MMKDQRKPLVMVPIAVLCAMLQCTGSALGTPTEGDIEKAVAAIRDYDYGQSRKTLLLVEKLINETHGNAELRAAIEKELVRVLESRATLACKQFVCQKLWIIGTDASLPALSKMLGSGNEHVVEAACYALSSNPSPMVDNVLQGALDRAEANGLIAVINLLGERRDEESARAIAGLTDSQDASVAEAAIAALGKIASDNAIKVLADLRKSDNPKSRTAASHAYLQCAQELEKRRRLADATAIYDELAASGEPEHVRRAARVGRERIEKPSAALPGNVDFTRIKAVPLFDGKTFTGWEGNLESFRIEDGAIVAGTLKKPIPRNEFLCTTRQYSGFELRLKVKLLGDPKTANAGIQIRSRRIPNHHEMIGYQADMGQHYWGNLYDESRRRKLLATVNQDELARVLKVGDWNEYVIRCVGKRIQLWINGYQTVDYTEPDNSIEQTGLIGLQIHGGPPSEAWYTDIVIKEVP